MGDESALREEIQELEATLQGLRKDRQNQPPKLKETQPGEIPAEVRAARERAKLLQENFRQINDRYTPAHPRWQAAKNELNLALAHWKKVDKGDPDQKVMEKDNPRIPELDTSIKEREKKLEKLNIKLLAETKNTSEKYDLLRRAPEFLTEKRRLTEERESASYLVDDYVKGLREADKELQRLSTEAYSSRYKVRDYARPSRVPISETRLKIIGIFAFVGLVIGVALIVLLEYLDQTFKTVDDVREALGVPALGVVPAIYTPRDHRRRLWFRVLALSSGVLVVGVLVLIYFTVSEVHEFLNEAWRGLQSTVSNW
jgi:ElaB/YqjD/DUF883 family membrane-anchored ribosome-binding protein